MNIKLSVFLLILITALSIYCNAQGGLLPSININKKLKRNWTVNFKAESRIINNSDLTDEGLLFIPQHNLTDISVITAKKTGFNTRAAAGYLLRVRNNSIQNRFIQQFFILHQKAGIRLAQRIATDQTFSAEQKPEIRLRYRIVAEIPLSGQTVNAKEFYLKIGNEFLNSYRTSYNLEMRAVPVIGFELNNKNKIETGVDYRISNLINKTPQQQTWFCINWFIEL